MKKAYKMDWRIPLVFIIALILRLTMYLHSFEFSFRTDDFGTLGYPAYLAGYDWSSFFAGTGHYYGFGYYWIFAPLFRLISSPTHLLFAMALFSSVLIVLTSLLVYHLAVTYLKMPRSWITVALSVMVTCFQGELNPRGRFWLRTDNEIPLFFMTWLFVWALLATYHETKKVKRIILSCLAALVMVWGLTTHERTLALIMAFVVVAVLFWLLRKEWVVHPVAFTVTLGVGFVLQRMLRSYVIHTMWQGGWPAKNTSAFSLASMWFLESVDALRSFFIVFFGNMHALLIRGFGIPAISIVICFYWIFMNFRERTRKASVTGGRAAASVTDGRAAASVTGGRAAASVTGGRVAASASKGQKAADADKEKVINASMLLTLVFGVCIAATILGLSVRWGYMLYPFIKSDTVGRGYKGICYSRYYYVFIGPTLLGTLSYCYHKLRDFSVSCTVAYWALLGVVELVFYSFVFPYCVKADMVYDGNIVRRALGTFVFSLSGEARRFLCIGFMFVTMVLITFALTRWLKASQNGDQAVSAGTLASQRESQGAEGLQKAVKTGQILLTAAVVFVALIFAADRLNQCTWEKPSIQFTDGACAVEEIKQLQSENVLPENIYLDGSYGAFLIQFCFKDMPFRLSSPEAEQVEESNLIIRSSRQQGYLTPGYREFQDGGGFWYYTNDEAAIRSMEADEDMTDGLQVPVEVTEAPAADTQAEQSIDDIDVDVE